MTEITQQADPVLLAGLRKAMAGPRRLQGKEGDPLFPSAKVAKGAIDQGFVVKRKVKVEGNKRAVDFGELTEKGRQYVLTQDNPKAVLEALLPAVKALGEVEPRHPNTEIVRAELEKAATAWGTALTEGVAKLQKSVETAFAKLQQSVVMAVASPPTDKLVDPTPVLDALRQTLAGLTVKGEPQVNASLETTIAGVVQDWAREKAAGCPFDVLMDQVKARQPGVTLGEFHDTLRGLHDAHRIRLSGWARSLDEMPDPELALFISHKVMYYANPAHQQT